MLNAYLDKPSSKNPLNHSTLQSPTHPHETREIPTNRSSPALLPGHTFSPRTRQDQYHVCHRQELGASHLGARRVLYERCHPKSWIHREEHIACIYCGKRRIRGRACRGERGGEVGRLYEYDLSSCGSVHLSTRESNVGGWRESFYDSRSRGYSSLV